MFKNTVYGKIDPIAAKESGASIPTYKKHYLTVYNKRRRYMKKQ